MGLQRQRQKARRGGDPVPLHDHRAVVQRRVGLEQGHQQVVTQAGVEFVAVLHVALQAGGPLHDDQGAGALRRQGHRRQHDVVHDAGPLRLEETPEEARLADVGQNLADLGLIDHDDGEDRVGHEVRQEPLDGVKLRGPGDEVNQHQEGDAAGDLGGAGALEQQKEAVDHEGDDEDIQHIGDGYRIHPDESRELLEALHATPPLRFGWRPRPGAPAGWRPRRGIE